MASINRSVATVMATLSIRPSLARSERSIGRPKVMRARAGRLRARKRLTVSGVPRI
jgi:hypothetical protein